jgi:phage virion morphogenesis protein
MAGSFVSVDVIGSSSVANALNRLIKKVDDSSPALRDIGEHLLESTQDRMSDEVDPQGQAWELLSVNTIEQKSLSSQSNKILRGYGTLADTLNYQLNGDQLLFGSNMEYAATHQFGREDANIPAREFLGFSDEDENEILDILHAHLSG